MLTRLYASNYRCLVNFEFKPSAKQLIIGRNGAGKTAVLDVLGMLRDLAASGKPCEEYLGGSTLTRWQTAGEQRFELEVQGNGGGYRYTLVVNEYGNPLRPLIENETLDFDGQQLLRHGSGVINLPADEHDDIPKLQFPSDSRRSAFTVLGDHWKRTKLTWFAKWLGGITEVQINPWAMSARSEQETRYPAKDMSNFADWYRHLLLEGGDAVFQAVKALREAIPGLDTLSLKEAGLDVRVLQVTTRGRDGETVDLPFSGLSEGQRCLIALYVLMYCGIDRGQTLLIDEPDNFIALAEIQPWLLKLLDRVDDTNGQVILVSHHPELLNQLASQGGILLDRPGGGETRVRPFALGDDTGLTPAEIIARGWENA